MIFFCEECGNRYDIDLEKIAENKRSFNCENCNDVVTIPSSQNHLINPIFRDLSQGNNQVKTSCRILIVDDSKLIRQAFCDIFECTEEIQVVGEAANGEEALEKINELQPDLIMLDVNMPIMNGETTLKQIMINTPCPVVITSNLSPQSQIKIIDFLCLGAVDFAGKPVRKKNKSIQQQKITERISLAAKARIDNFKRVKPPKVIRKQNTRATTKQIPSELLIVMNTGMGGFAELLKVIPLLPEDLKACIVSLQTIPPELKTATAEYFDQISPVKVLPLQNDAPLVEGTCYIGINGLPAQLIANDGKYSFKTDQPAETHENNFKPFDFFLRSIADSFSGHVLVVLLSGADIGNLEGLQRIREKAGRIIVEDPSFCMVPFPVEAVVQANLADLQTPPLKIANHIIDFKSPDFDNQPNI